MRSRSNSGVRLDYYQRLVTKTILKHQNPVTGLLPATPEHAHAWVRDNVYSILAVWAVALSYRKTADLDEDKAKAYELEQSVVKMMRGLLKAMMSQVDKVEKFKFSQSPKDCLHAKYNASTGRVAVGDGEWGHLQLDATSLYMLQLAQMTASGLQIIYTLDEVSFIQNLVFYIQCAYRTPDYGIWERGDKTNHGVPELNASSIGMAKAALEAVNGLDLFGARGGPSSVIHVMPDEAQQCQAILHSVLPRESNSKETDAGLLSIISYPAFAVDDQELIDLTRNDIIEKLQGRYGLRRFLRDGYKTPKEDPNRLHYNPWELQGFENIECHWPMFFAYLVLDGLFNGRKEQVNEYADALEEVMIKTEDGLKLIPELYALTADQVDGEIAEPGSQKRMAVGKIPHMWGQSLYIVARLVLEGFLSPGELDPLNRRLTAEPKPDIVVQIVILAEDRLIQDKLLYYDLRVETIAEAAPMQLYAASVLSDLFAHLGTNRKMRLTGRPQEVAGVLATSKLYSLGGQILAFFPQFVDQQQFYLPLDTSLLLDTIKTDIQYLGSSWKMMGRPLMVIPIRKALLDVSGSLHPALVGALKKLQTGYISGTRVHLGHLNDFVNTSCITNLEFLTEAEDLPDLDNLLKHIRILSSLSSRNTNVLGIDSSISGRSRPGSTRTSTATMGGGRVRRKSSVWGFSRRTCSIQVDPGEMPDLSHLLAIHTGGGRKDGRMGGLGSPGASVPTSPGATLSTPSNSACLFMPGQQGHSSHPHLKGLANDMEESKIMNTNEVNYDGIDSQELVDQLKEAETLHEQADIIHYLFTHMGAEWDTQFDGRSGCRVKDLLAELYDKAGHMKQWWLVRNTAGMLRKRVDDLSKAATDIIVRQKQLAVGLPPEPREKIITRPLPPDELASIIHEACGDDNSTAMLTQEILVYLAMFIRTEPKLFNEMLRIRVGLIIQVMASELARTLKCSGEEASDQLLNLSPFEMKTLLHHILSGKEFSVNADLGLSGRTNASGSSAYNNMAASEKRLSFRAVVEQHTLSRRGLSAKQSVDRFRREIKRISTVEELGGTLHAAPSGVEAGPGGLGAGGIELVADVEGVMETDKQGQWLRRRRLDGALNRVPVGFYTDNWKLLRRCHGLSIGSNILSQSLTSEMTAGEIKFALCVESVLNKVTQPEYRQLLVEGIMILTQIVEHDSGVKCVWDEVINVDSLVHCANQLFIDEQKDLEGDVTLCCGSPGYLESRRAGRHEPLICGGTANICQNFYDSAPSGRYGTMSYLFRAVVQCLRLPTGNDGSLDCAIQ